MIKSLQDVLTVVRKQVKVKGKIIQGRNIQNGARKQAVGVISGMSSAECMQISIFLNNNDFTDWARDESKEHEGIGIEADGMIISPCYNKNLYLENMN